MSIFLKKHLVCISPLVAKYQSMHSLLGGTKDFAYDIWKMRDSKKFIFMVTEPRKEVTITSYMLTPVHMDTQ